MRHAINIYLLIGMGCAAWRLFTPEFSREMRDPRAQKLFQEWPRMTFAIAVFVACIIALIWPVVLPSWRRAD